MSEGEGRPQIFISTKGGTESVHSVPPIEEGPKTDETPEEFPKTIFAQKPEDISKIKTDPLRRKVTLLHEAFAEDPDLLDVGDLQKEADSVKEKIESGEYPSEEAKPIWKVIKSEIKRRKDEEARSQRRSDLVDDLKDVVELVGAGAVGGAADDFVEGHTPDSEGQKSASSESSSSTKTPSEPETSKAKAEEKSESATNHETKNEYRNFSQMNYGQLRMVLQDPKLSNDSRLIVEGKMREIEQQIRDFDKGDPFKEFVLQFTAHVESHGWNDLQKGEENLDRKKAGWARDFAANPGYNKRWDGAIETAVEGAKAELLLAGIKQRIGQSADPANDEELEIWALRHQFDEDEVVRLQRVSAEKNIFPELLGDTPELLVGSQMPEVDPAYRRLQRGPADEERLAELAKSMGDERYVPIQAPKHVGAVFVGGLFEKMFRHETIPPCDITTAAGREKFILENIHAFDYLLQEPGAWKGAVGAWLDDMYFASKSAANVKKFGENPENAEKRFEDVISEFEAKVKAMMAVTASARAMEKSNGSIEAYGVWLTTGGQGKEADLDIQDQYKDYILHDDPKKLDLVLENPLVRKYFRKITSDMGARSITTDKKKGTRRYYRTKEIEDIRKGGNSCRLIEYLKNGAEKGGFLSYIEKEILGSEDRSSSDWDTKLAAARLASDLIMVDGTYTQWEYEVTNGKKGEQAIRAQYSSQATVTNQGWVDRKIKLWEDLKLFPIKNYGGDPLRSLKEASYLHLKIKGVYKDELGREIMADLDRAMRPTKIFESPTLDKKKIEKGELTRQSYEITHNMTEGWKKMARWGRADWILVGGSQAEKLGVFSRETAEELKVIALRLNEVYGGITEEFDKNDPRNTTLLRRYPDGKYPLGKHMVGKMMAEIFKLKAKAYTAQRQRAGVFDRISQTMGDIKTHPNYEILAMLWGPDVDAKSGVRADLSGSELQLIFKGNDFGAYDDLLATKAILETGDPHATATSGRAARAMGRGIGGIFRSFAGGGKR